jgi:hypothetical protein
MSSGTILWPMASTKQQKSTIDHGLPIISGNTIDAIYHVYGGKRWGEHLTAYKDQLIQENPELVEFIESQISKFPRNMHIAMFEVVIGTLTLLEHQVVADERHRKRTRSKGGRVWK